MNNLAHSIEGSISTIISHDTSKFSDSGCKFFIGKIYNEIESKEYKIKGEMNSPVYGWKYRFYGEWKDDKYAKRANDQIFHFNTFEPIIKGNKTGLVDYLARHIPELGMVKSKAIVDYFNEDTLQVLKESPDLIKNVAGIGPVTCNKVIEFFNSEDSVKVDPASYARLVDLLSPIRPPRRIINQLVKHFGSNAPQYILENPYRLLSYIGMGWKRVDDFAVNVCKYDKNGIHRHMNAITESMNQFADQGHTKIDLASVKENVSRLIGMVARKDAIKLLESEIPENGILRNKVLYIDKDDDVSLVNLMEAEQSIACELRRIRENAQEFDFQIDTEGLEEEQVPAIKVIQDNGVAILSGVAGSGKSWCVSKVISSIYENNRQKMAQSVTEKYKDVDEINFDDLDSEINWNQHFWNILVIAPTGKAAKRNEELLARDLPGIKITCSTIHKALGARSSTIASEGVPEEDAKQNRGRSQFQFTHDKNHPLEYNYIVVDEFSMCDCELGASLFEAIPNGARLLLVGDHNQLPSVGPGSILRDLINNIPSAILDKPRRNSGLIAQSCYQIKKGKHPVGALSFDLPNGVNWVHQEESNDENILDIICDINQNFIDKYGEESAKWDLQVISPEKKGKLGCHSINARLSPIINCNGHDNICTDSGIEKLSLRIGDKVIRTKNRQENILLRKDIDKDSLINIYGEDVAREMEAANWRQTSKNTIFDSGSDPLVPDSLVGEWLIQRCHLVNGDMGEVVHSHKIGNQIHVMVKFLNPLRLCDLPLGDAKIILAYALTCHKVQGSGFNTVVCPITNFYWNTISNSGLYNRELVYTMFSRAIDKLITIGRIKELYKAIDRNTVNFRKTRLKDMVKKKS